MPKTGLLLLIAGNMQSTTDGKYNKNAPKPEIRKEESCEVQVGMTLTDKNGGSALLVLRRWDGQYGIGGCNGNPFQWYSSNYTTLQYFVDSYIKIHGYKIAKGKWVFNQTGDRILDRGTGCYEGYMYSHNGTVFIPVRENYGSGSFGLVRQDLKSGFSWYSDTHQSSVTELVFGANREKVTLREGKWSFKKD